MMGANTAKHGLDDIQELIGGRERGRTLVCEISPSIIRACILAISGISGAALVLKG